MTERLEWKPIKTAPMDGGFRFYGLHVRNGKGFCWFEAHYVSLDEDGQLLEPSGDYFSDWDYDDFEVWAPAPLPPADGVSEDK